MDTSIIGAGEITTKQILAELFPTAEFRTQVSLSDLLRGDYKKSMSERQKKETLDIVMHTNKHETIVFRVQDKHHMTQRMGMIDRAQMRVLQSCGCRVVDVWFYDAKNVFKDIKNKASESEIKSILKREGIKY